jgi:uncharacterized alpha-E superfamily protein
MTHDEAWHFARLGRLLERADKTSRLLDVKCRLLLPDPRDAGMPIDELEWAALLESASAFETYRKRFGRIAPARVVELLLLERQFPRAVSYALTKAERSLHAITGAPIGAGETSAERRVGRLRGELERADVGALFAGGLDAYLGALQTDLDGVGEAIHDTFFEARAGRGGATSQAQ